MHHKILPTMLLALVLSSGSFAQDGTEGGDSQAAPPQPERYPCKKDPKFREFDFWIGSWNVTANDQPAGTNEIQLILGDCVLFENWESATGGLGKSFSFYDAAREEWRQLWIDDRGGAIDFAGDFKDGKMQFKAKTKSQQSGEDVLHNFIFTPNEDGSVRQFWEFSNDGGETWQTAFDGHYTKQ